MIEELAKAFFRRVYYPITAVVSLDEQDQVIHVELMDSLFASADDVADGRTQRIVVIFSHPDGRTEMMREEIVTLRRIEAYAGSAVVNAYIYGEDIGLCEVDKVRILGYNEENVI